MKYTLEAFGKLPDGRKIEKIILENDNGIQIQTMNLGASLISAKMKDRNGHLDEITLGFKKLDDYLNKRYFFGSTAGRFANRIGNARFELNGKKYQLKNNDGKNHLHGGEKGFDLQFWDHAIFQEPGKISVAYTYLSKDGEEGYPGNLSVTALYTLTDDDDLVMEYFAETDIATPVNLTNHTYWNLNGIGKDVLGHELKLNCQEFLEVDNGLIPTGKILSVEGSPFDFTSVKKVKKDFSGVEGGYDHCLVIIPSGNKDPFREMGEIYDPDSGRGMKISTTQNAVQFYTGNHLDGVIGREGHSYDPQAAFCLETQNYPDAVNKSNFPSSILEADEHYREKTVHHFFVR